jgi:hypothetical protein
VTRVALICDNGRIAQWQRRALEEAGVTRIALLLDCRNTCSQRRLIAHGGYYLLNMLAIRSRATRMVDVASCGIAVDEHVAFDAETAGAWQSLPATVLARVRAVAPAVIVKFGMGLLRVPPFETLPAPILSYHHGDPAAFRGRPAGFWETARGTPLLGQVVQVLANRLDAGAVVAQAETKVYAHSYRATMIEAYRHSPLLLAPAIARAVAGEHLPAGHGPNHRLPSNAAVAGMAARMARKWLGRLAYGALFEKEWRVSIAPRPADPLAATPATARELPVPRGYTILADPFLCANGDVLAEGVHARSGLGHILRIAHDGAVETVMAGQGHASYPAVVATAAGEAMLPETARWATPALYPLDGSARVPLAIEGDPRLLDPTLFAHGGQFYLFANDHGVGPHAQMLWVADAQTGPYRRHPASPIRISPRGGRMGGAILGLNGRLYRLGQDGARGYGERLVAFEVTTLTLDAYAEREAGEIAFAGVRGPHTLNVNADRMVFDHYHERFAPLAGVRRLMARLR